VPIEELRENVEGAGNCDSLASGDSCSMSLNKHVCEENAYFWTTFCML
jgi:hypothetical protein